MRIRAILAATLGAVTLCAVALAAAPGARADVGDVDITYYNGSGVVIGTAQDVFGNLTQGQCDGNSPPTGTASVSVTNLTDETVDFGQTCANWLQPVPPLGTIRRGWGSNTLDVYAPSGA
jgi:hypothetical protein